MSDLFRLNDSLATPTVTRLVDTATPTARDFGADLSPEGSLYVAIYLIVTGVLAVMFNGLVIFISVRNWKVLQVADVFVFWLAASDIGQPLIAYPMVIASSIEHTWLFGHIGCQFNGFVGFFFGINSMMTLAAMAYGRLLVVTEPKFSTMRRRYICWSLLTGCFLFSSFWASAPLFGWGAYGREPHWTSCTLVWAMPDKTFVTLCFVFCLAVPAAIMIYSYTRILYVSSSSHRRISWVPCNQRRRSSVMRRMTLERKDRRLLKMTVVMCVSFLMCWTPYAVVAMIQSYAPLVTISTFMSVIPGLAAKSSHVLDPIIYCAMNKNFSRMMKNRFIFGQPSRLSSPSGSLRNSMRNSVVMPLKNLVTAWPCRQNSTKAITANSSTTPITKTTKNAITTTTARTATTKATISSKATTSSKAKTSSRAISRVTICPTSAKATPSLQMTSTTDCLLTTPNASKITQL